jgi:hypothetical protein
MFGEEVKLEYFGCELEILGNYNSSQIPLVASNKT